jgi:carbamate kinase
VALNFGTPQQKEIPECSLSEIRRYLAMGHFLPGSMGPKIEAAVYFLERGGKRVIIASLEESMQALQGQAGTHIYQDRP